jgi:hypothetical protein
MTKNDMTPASTTLLKGIISPHSSNQNKGIGRWLTIAKSQQRWFTL